MLDSYVAMEMLCRVLLNDVAITLLETKLFNLNGNHSVKCYNELLDAEHCRVGVSMKKNRLVPGMLITRNCIHLIGAWKPRRGRSMIIRLSSSNCSHSSSDRLVILKPVIEVMNIQLVILTNLIHKEL